jgi:hypothetical protein
MVFYDLWAGRAVKTTLAPKFGGLAQRWGRAGLKEGGAGANHGRGGLPHSPWGWGLARGGVPHGGDRWRRCLLPRQTGRHCGRWGPSGEVTENKFYLIFLILIIFLFPKGTGSALGGTLGWECAVGTWAAL